MEYKSPLSDDYYSEPRTPSYGCNVFKHSRRRDPRNSPYSRESHGNGRAKYCHPTCDNDSGTSNSVTENSNPSYMDQYRLPSYPKELTDMFQAVECKLCGVELTSPIVAKMHYSGKPHMKKISRFLSEWSLRTGNAVPESGVPVISSTTDVLEDYCELCDVHMIQINDRLQHFAGKTHRKNASNPSRALRKKQSSTNTDTSDHRFGIGADFSSAGGAKPKANVCEICNVKTVSHDQLQIHLMGKKHKEQLKKTKSVETSEEQFKCLICDAIMDTESMYDIHINSKRHLKTLLKRESESSGAIEKFSITCKYCPYVGHDEKHDCRRSIAESDVKDSKPKWVCTKCDNMEFDSEEAYDNHKTSRRHLLGLFNGRDRDPVRDPFLYCNLCQKQYYSLSDFSNHFTEPEHQSFSSTEKNLENSVRLFRCTPCNMVFDKDGIEEHVKDKKHLTQAVISNSINKITDIGNKDVSAISFPCEDCNVTLDSYTEYSVHLLTAEHLEREVSKRLE